jgi:hypothetical protein
MYVLSANFITHRPAAQHDPQSSFPRIAGRNLKWDLQQERATGKGRRTDLAAPTEDNELAEEAPPLKSIMYLYPREKGAFVREQDASYRAIAQS